MTWSHRPALDGIRTLAVYLVLLFHAEWSWAPGGFIGVDLFFVLSGFLVSTILYEELADRGRLDLLHFYERRVRRLLPAALLTIVVTCLISVLVLPAADRGTFAGDARASLLYFANWHFVHQANDYFGATVVDRSPFLHFWSLSIEEQFYFLFPALLVLLWRWQKHSPHRPLVLTLVLLLGGSVALQVWWARIDPNHAYYGTETRFYQLLAGVLLGLLLHRRRRSQAPPLPPWSAHAATLVGALGLVLVASPALDLSPSWRGLAATPLAVLLVAGLSGEHVHASARLFTVRPVVYLGVISYGTYLWHWPVVVFLAQVVDPPDWQRALLVAGLATALASASFHMLERPIRLPRLRPAWRVRVVAGGLTASVVLGVFVLPVVTSVQQPPAVVAGSSLGNTGDDHVSGPPPDLAYARITSKASSPERACDPSDLSRCEVVSDQDGPHLLVFGDSQTFELEPALTRLARTHGFNLTVLSLGGCPWPEGVHNLNARLDARKACARLRADFWRELVVRRDVDAVLLIQLDRSLPGFSSKVTDSVEGLPVKRPDEHMLSSVERNLTRLDRLGVPTLVLDSVWLPRGGQNPMACLSGAEDILDCRVQVDPRVTALQAGYRRASLTMDNIHLLDLADIYCPRAPVCDAVLDGVPVWRDSRHLWSEFQVARRGQIWRAMKATGALDDF